MATKDFEERRNRTDICASEDLCTFLATLINSEITTLTIPPISTKQMECSFKRVTQFLNNLLIADGKAPLSLGELNKAFRGVPMLIDAICTKCPTLKSLHILTLPTYKEYIPLMKDKSLGDSFFKVVLPRLTILKMDYYKCDDWALLQIASHATSLV
jgi:hypothetical protein